MCLFCINFSSSDSDVFFLFLAYFTFAIERPVLVLVWTHILVFVLIWTWFLVVLNALMLQLSEITVAELDWSETLHELGRRGITKTS